jgi:DNA polymerase-3 subunit delta'
LLSFTGGSPFNAIKELENQSERDVITQLLSQGHKIDFTKINYAILTQGLDWTLNIVQKWIFDLLLSFHTQQSHYFKGQEAQIFSQTKQLNLNTLLLFASELNELKKIASHPVNQELQLQNIFVKYKQIFEPS